MQQRKLWGPARQRLAWHRRPARWPTQRWEQRGPAHPKLVRHRWPARWPTQRREQRGPAHPKLAWYRCQHGGSLCDGGQLSPCSSGSCGAQPIRGLLGPDGQHSGPLSDGGQHGLLSDWGQLSSCSDGRYGEQLNYEGQGGRLSDESHSVGGQFAPLSYRGQFSPLNQPNLFHPRSNHSHSFTQAPSFSPPSTTYDPASPSFSSPSTSYNIPAIPQSMCSEVCIGSTNCACSSIIVCEFRRFRVILLLKY